RKEGDPLKPWLTLAKYKLEAENELQKIPNLPLVILRLANVYGEYCTKTVGTMLCMAQTYRFLGRSMKWLWTKDLKQNTVHVSDVARAMWAVATWYASGKPKWDASAWGPTPIFNVVDRSATDQ